MSPILYRELGRNTEGETVLRAAIATSPQDAALHYALGLALTRLKQADAALAELTRAAELGPGRARYAYVHAVPPFIRPQRRRAEGLTAPTIRLHSPSAQDRRVRTQGIAAIALISIR